METLNNVYTPYIGANGNWYVENEDTGVKAQGAVGHQGPVGPQGEIGPKGETGDRGPQGLKGDTPELAENLTTTTAGKALDATMGKMLDDKVEKINHNFQWKTVFNGTAAVGTEYATHTNFAGFNEIWIIAASGQSYNLGHGFMEASTYPLYVDYYIPVGNGYVRMRVQVGGGSFIIMENTSGNDVRRIRIR